MNASSITKAKVGNIVHTLWYIFLPGIIMFAYLLGEGVHFNDVFLPASNWNDELLYYKMVESIANFHLPQGYFGFNESHALVGTFAAWSPLLLMHWIGWGMLFGWNFFAPFFANICILSFSFICFYYCCKPRYINTIFISVFLLLFKPLGRFLLSCIPEIEIISLAIIFVSLAVVFFRSRNRRQVSIIIIHFFLLALLTWMRPYLLLLVFTPLYEWIFYKKNDSKGYRVLLPIVLSAVITGFILFIYLIISKYLSAPYIEDLFYTDWIDAIKTTGLINGMRYSLNKLWGSFKVMVGLIMDCYSKNTFFAAGLYYATFIICGLLYLAQMIYECRLFKERNNQQRLVTLFIRIQLILCMMGFFFADLLMYRIQEGGRHALVYIVLMILTVGLFSDCHNKYLYYLLSFGLCAWLGFSFVLCGDIPYEFALPSANKVQAIEFNDVTNDVSQRMLLTESEDPYANTVIWTALTPFGYYYMIPEGFGINYCETEYLNSNINGLRSKYIGIIASSSESEELAIKGWHEIFKYEDFVIYQNPKYGK